MKYYLTRMLQRYGMMRIEATTAQIHTTTIQIRSAVADGFARTHGHGSPLRVSDENTLAFLGSAPVILSTLPPHVQLSERLVYRSYITVQVGKIEGIFKSLASRASYPIEEPDSLHLQPFLPVTGLKPSTDAEIEGVHSDAFALIVKIQESLKSRHNRPSIQRGAQAMSNLSVLLSNLGMDHESLKIVQFAVDLYRTLNKTNEDVYGPCLAHALCELSRSYVITGDVVEAYKVITEAVTLGRRLADASPTFESQMQLVTLVSFSSLVGRWNRDWTNALNDAEEAVESYQRLVGNPESILPAEVGIAEGLRMTLEGTHLRNYSRALKELHYSLSMTTRHDESVKAGVQALEIYRGLEQKQSNGAFSAEIAHLCYSLASDVFRETVTVDQALLYTRESVQHYEKILQNTGVVPNDLPDALGLEGELLSSLKRFDEAYEVCLKLQRMIQIQMDSQQLRARSLLQLTKNLFDAERYAEAALTGEQLLSMYQSLLSDEELKIAYGITSLAFDGIGDYTKYIQVAEESVTHWRMLALRNKKYLKYVARSVLSLTHAFFRAKDHERAFKEGGEGLKLYSSLVAEDASLLEYYKIALTQNLNIARNAKMELESLERSRLVVQYSRALVNQFPAQQPFLIRCIRDYARLLEAFDHLADASVAISEALDWFNDRSAQDSESAELHTFCLLISARSLRLQGYPNRALSLLEKTSAIGQPFLDAYSVAQNILWAKAYNLLSLYLMGQILIACSEIDVCLNFASEHNLETHVAYFWCLDIASRIYRCTGRIDIALPIIRRSVALRRQYSKIPFSWILSDLLADAGQEAEAIDAAHDAVREWVKWKDSPRILLKEYHVLAQYSLAVRLFASGDFTQTQELLAQVRSFYQEHSKARNIWFIDLAITLWALGLLECASGRHEEGIAARTELNELLKRLRLVFPSLADLVEVGLNRERNFAAWKNLLEKYNLSCGHQDEDEISEGNADSSDSKSTHVTSPDHVLTTSANFSHSQ